MANETMKITGTAAPELGGIELELNISLRDLFAAFALAGLATTLLEADAPAAGRIAYTFADAALKNREENK